jgi:hypothetical protein
LKEKRKGFRTTSLNTYLPLEEKRKVLLTMTGLNTYLLIAEKRKVLRMTRMTQGRRWTKRTRNLR